MGGARETSTPVTSSTALWTSQESFGSPGTVSLSPRPLWEAHQQAYVMTKITSRPIYWGSLQFQPYSWQSRWTPVKPQPQRAGRRSSPRSCRTSEPSQETNISSSAPMPSHMLSSHHITYLYLSIPKLQRNWR